MNYDVLQGDMQKFTVRAPSHCDCQAWSAWLQRQGLSRLLRHDSRGALRSDGVTTKAARLEIQNFRLKGMADGQAGSRIISG